VKKVLICKACGEPLTTPLRQLCDKDTEVPGAIYADREPLTEAGTVLESFEPLGLADWPITEISGFAPQY